VVDDAEACGSWTESPGHFQVDTCVYADDNDGEDYGGTHEPNDPSLAGANIGVDDGLGIHGRIGL